MSSFTRSIPAYQPRDFVDQILARSNHYLPLAYRPTRARAGDFIYLIYQGLIVGRARISAIEPVGAEVQPGSERPPDWAKWMVRYRGAWQLPPREIHVQGHQSVRYLETQSLEHLDTESWTASM